MSSYLIMAKTLHDLGFADYYKNSVSGNKCKINYGKRKGVIEFSSIKDAAKKYSYEKSGKYTVGIDRQLGLPDSTSDNELILQCIEVFDWGGVQASNIIDALNLYRKGELKPALEQWKGWFEDDKTLSLNMKKILWSSGWTKVFSFMFELTTIYDSRVAAYINYILVGFYQSLDSGDKQDSLKSITCNLVSFTGPKDRSRQLNRQYRELLGIKIKCSDAERNFRANKMASWLVRYLCELEYGEATQQNFRKVDKALYMLGFDISQLEHSAPFN
ncbi:hypothetical protein HG263_02050 [Pseudoalteromonas sp. JBTF-M23]|uniref:Uncharacterized protein n=1 Tax=Pseudoalteromonas caenipelagi TaxID=2726988 RepID=A0A849VBH4_9GAMM|nr:hypothetical protein [Pseudoalteromonas caenipelagi]NOU49334.1 hypothetical protein [Pseudoalteromonas caenipelagi]